MAKWKKILVTAALVTMAALAGCGDKDKEPDITDKEIFEDELIPLDEDEIKKMEEDYDEDSEMQQVDEEDLEKLDAGALDDMDENTED